MEAVQFAKTRSLLLFGPLTNNREDKDKGTPEGIAEAEQIAEVLLASHPRKNTKGETIEMSVDEALVLNDEQDKAWQTSRTSFPFTCQHFQKWVCRLRSLCFRIKI